MLVKTRAAGIVATIPLLVKLLQRVAGCLLVAPAARLAVQRPFTHRAYFDAVPLFIYLIYRTMKRSSQNSVRGFRAGSGVILANKEKYRSDFAV